MPYGDWLVWTKVPRVSEITLARKLTKSQIDAELFGYAIQNQGAKSVLATLWPIADPSTRDLMIEFYRDLAINRRNGKATALRKAQLALLRGSYKASCAFLNAEIGRAHV